jgi:hypothetical protein
MVLRDKGLEEDEGLVPWEVVFIGCVCATTAAGTSINTFNVLIPNIIATAHTMAVATAIPFLIGIS